MLRAITAVTLLAAHAHAAFTPIEADFFAGAAVVGVDPINGPGPRTVGFDFAPDGSAIATPNQFGSLFASNGITNVFAPVGLLLNPAAVAVSQPSNPSGIGTMSGSNALAAGIPSNGTLTFMFTQGASAAGFFALDGPTNEVTASFFDTQGQLITTLTADAVVDYLGITSDDPIGFITVTTTASDDYYVEDLSFTALPAPAGALIAPLALTVASRRRRAR